MRNFKCQILVWIIWSVVWFISNEALMQQGIIEHQSWYFLVIDCVLSIVAVILIIRKKLFGILTLVIFVISIITNFGAIAIFSAIMALILLVLTAITTPKKEGE